MAAKAEPARVTTVGRRQFAVEIHPRLCHLAVVQGDEQVDQLRCGVDLEVLLRPAEPGLERRDRLVYQVDAGQRRRLRTTPSSTARRSFPARCRRMIRLRCMLSGRAQRSPNERPRPRVGQASITTGTIIGRRLVRSLTNLPAARRTSRSRASTSRTPAASVFSTASATASHASSSRSSASGA